MQQIVISDKVKQIAFWDEFYVMYHTNDDARRLIVSMVLRGVKNEVEQGGFFLTSISI